MKYFKCKEEICFPKIYFYKIIIMITINIGNHRSQLYNITTRKLWSVLAREEKVNQTGDSGLAFSMNLSWLTLMICSVRLK